MLGGCVNSKLKILHNASQPQGCFGCSVVPNQSSGDHVDVLIFHQVLPEKSHTHLYTVTIWIMDLSSIQMVKVCSIVKWSVIPAMIWIADYKFMNWKIYIWIVDQVCYLCSHMYRLGIFFQSIFDVNSQVRGTRITWDTKLVTYIDKRCGFRGMVV